MCLLALSTPGSKMTDRQIKQAWLANPDGGGFAYIGKGGTVRPFRTLSRKAFIQAYHQAIRRHSDSPFLIHFRLATHGTKDLTNVHPFPTGESTWMAHNGILPIITRDRLSDTHVFAKDWIPQFPRNWLDLPAMVTLVEDFTWGSKLAFLTTDPELERRWYILNEEDGKWDKGVWFSNDSYKPFLSSTTLAQRNQRKLQDKAAKDKQVTLAPTGELAALIEAEDAKDERCQLCSEPTWFGVCEDCGLCNDCDSQINNCGCYIPRHIRDEIQEADAQAAQQRQLPL